MGQEKTRLYVSKISYGMRDQDLHELFSEYGTVKEAKVIIDRKTKLSRGFGFVEMNTAVEAERCLALDGIKSMGRTIEVSFARERAK